MIVYKRIRQTRQSKKLSLENLSTFSGLSPSYLSQVERGIVNPSLSALNKIAESLEISVSSLLSQESDHNLSHPAYSVISQNQRHKLIYPGSNVSNEMLTPTMMKEFEFFWTSISPGKGSRDEPYSHPGYECGLVIEGVMEFYIGDDRVTLNAGQSICFDPNIPHYWKNIGESDVHAVWVVLPAQF